MMSSIFSCDCWLFVYLLWRTRWYFSPVKLADMIFKIFVWCNVIEAILMKNTKCWLKKIYVCLKMGLLIAQFWSRHEDNRYYIPKWVVWYSVLSGSVMPDSLWPHGLYPPGSSVHGIFQARMLEYIAISSSRGSSWLRDRTLISCISCIGRSLLYQLCHLGSPSSNGGC